jgi:type 1 glutamine amidotransferase
MRRLVAFITLACFAVAWVVPARAEKPAEKIRVLLSYGGHGFQQAPFFAIFDALPNVEYTKAELPGDAGLLKPGLQDDYDAIVMYDMVRAIAPDQQKAFVALLEQGIGVVSLHHNLGAHRDWDEFVKIIGGKFLFGDATLEGEAYKKSTWSHGENLRVTVADKDHPITQGLEDFEIHDETYGGYYTASDVHVLLRTDHPKNDAELAWTKTYGKSRVFYLMLGHDRHAWENPNYGKILAAAIRWAAGH